MITKSPEQMTGYELHKFLWRREYANRTLAKEFRERPLGPHSAALQKLLELFRGEPLENKYVLVSTEDQPGWRIGLLSGRRGEGVVMLNDHFYLDLAEAEWTVFKLRWKRWAGDSLE